MPTVSYRGIRKLCAVGLGALLGIVVYAVGYAQVTLPADLACRDCHGDSSRQVEFPSGEALPVQVDLAQIDASPHGHGGRAEIACTTCHTGQVRYLYPHTLNPAQTRAEFRADVSTVCADCHYSHLPFHDAETMSGTLPTCADCHGGHNIARVDVMADALAANCLACHTDQTTAWTNDFVAPRPGMGAGDAEFAGSIRCNGCHEDLVAAWRDTLHAQVVRDPATDAAAILADFSAADPHLTFTQDEVAYVIGSRWRQVFLTWSAPMTATGDAGMETQPALELLPAQWTVASATWEPLSPFGDGAAGDPWLKSCAGCHVTGLDVASGGFTEFGVGCESCHGPSAAHASDPETVKPYAQPDDQVCGACHSRGAAPDGHPYPATYRPGDDLTAHFAFTQDADAFWADGSARRNHQQYMDWNLDNTMVQAPDTSCITCHQVHAHGDAPAQLWTESNALCLSCHGEQQAIVRHIPFHEKALQKRDFLCTDCHMPKLASGAQPFDLHSHSLLHPAPGATVAHGGLEAMPNACNSCHTSLAETPEWAQQIVSYAVVQSRPSSSSFFGPGPTPTSPPPPTPVASVGQRGEVNLTPPGWWIRWLMYGAAGGLAVAVVVFVIRMLRPRRTDNA